jgi:hypothetical protein
VGLRVKLDEDLPAAVVKVVEAHNHIARTVPGQGWGGLKDEALWPRVIAEGEFFITADKGFGDVRSYPPGTHNGIMVLRPAKESVRSFVELLDTTLKNHRLEDLVGTISVATTARLRIRRKTP